MPKFLAKPIIAKNGGDEGGELLLEKADTNTTINTGVTIDVYQNRLRFFEQGGTARGAYIDITACSAGVGTNLLSGGGGGGTTMPSGAVMQYAGSTAPSGWLLCDGSAISRSAYADLFTAIGTTYGAGNGTTTFNLPDTRGRDVIGAGTGTGLTARTLGATGGAESVTLTSAQSGLVGHGHANTFSASTGTESANHSHGITIDGNNFNTGGSGLGSHQHNIPRQAIGTAGTNRAVVSSTPTQATLYTNSLDVGSLDHTHNANHAHTGSSGTQSANHSHTVTVAGAVTDAASANASASHENMMPFLVLNYIIKT